MGFYGNITNTTSSQFTFDKIYPNRQAMDAGVTTDGVYVNRFVLIEYDVSLANALNNNMTRIDASYVEEFDDGYKILVNGVPITYEDIKNDSRLSIVYTCEIDNTNPNFPIEKNHKFYGCKELNVDNLEDIAIYKLISQANNSGLNYITNYQTDQDTYGVSRGYDSTVWQKLYIDGTEKYVMIAELNSVVPTFDVSPDAPAMSPIVPHFDKSSTNVYYKLHWQAPWGFRVAGADDNNPSDEQTIWYRDKYDSETGTTIREYYDEGAWRELTEQEIANKQFPQRAAAIYYNKKAFDPQVNETNTDPENIDGRVDIEDEIKVVPTGKSGNKYNKHDGTADLGEIADIQEMTINLPSIGNMMSDAWDIIHGPARNNSKVESLQGILNTFEEMEGNQIPYKRLSTGEIIGAELAGDDWIAAQLDDVNQKINITHKDSPQTISNSNNININFNNQNSGNQFNYYTLEADDKGHVKKGTRKTTVTLPNGFNEIQTVDGGSLVKATTPTSAFKISTDDWIKVKKSEDTEATLKLYHEAHTQQWGELDEEVNKDNSETYFNLTAIDGADAAGHIDYYYTKTVYFPWSFSKVETDEENSSITAEAVNSTFKIGGDNKWTETEAVDSDKILVKHKVKENALKENYFDDDSATYTFFDAKIDAAGHITEYERKNVPASLSVVYAHIPDAEPFKISADFRRRSVDIYGDSFITLSGNTTTQESDSYNSGFTINHALMDEFKVSSSTQLDAREIIIYNDQYDEAGHRNGRVEITYKLPNYYSTIEIPTVEGSTSITPNTEGNIILKGKSEEIKIGDNTKTTTNWITVNGDEDSNTILIDHNDPNKEDPNQIEVGSIKSAQIPYFSYDSKGHIITSGKKDLSGDKWVSIVNDETLNEIKVQHNDPSGETVTYAGRNLNIEEDQTFIFEPGDTIIIPYIGYDSKGHVYEIKEQQAKLPTQIGVAKVVINDETELESTRNKLIMNGMSVSEESGNVIPWYTTTKSLLLNDYNTPLSDTGESLIQWRGNINSGDSINSALGKLEYKINNLSNNGEGSSDFTIAAPIIMTGNKALTSLSYINNQLVPCYATTNSFKISGYYEHEIDTMIDLTQPIGNDDTINTALRKLSHQATFKTSGILTTVNDLSNQVAAMGPIRTDFNNLSNFVMFTLSKNVDALEARVQALETALTGSQAEEISISEDEIEQIANNLDNI